MDSRLPGCKRKKIDIIEPFDCILVPTGVYRGFRHLGKEPKDALLTIIGGPDAGKVDWAQSVLEQAAKLGLARDAKGELVIKEKASA